MLTIRHITPQPSADCLPSELPLSDEHLTTLDHIPRSLKHLVRLVEQVYVVNYDVRVCAGADVSFG